ncbi:MAG TPA: DDE-type integrase/transposase/recombinase [Nitrososphaeraceae archaeon]|nr:DDE-type integrase/transposase/recombinase [Nitrososphaeraceae archaeon]
MSQRSFHRYYTYKTPRSVHYWTDRSFRLAAKCLESTIRSHVAIWKWVQKYSDRTDRFVTPRHLVRDIFVDETLLKIDGQDYWLWIAYEPNLNTCLMMHLSRERTIFVCYQFFRQLRNRYMVVEKSFTQMELDGIMMLVNGSC